MMPFRLFYVVTLLESISFLILLGIAMPLKYIWHEPLAVRYVGMAHGALFVAYIASVFYASMDYAWPWTKTLRLASYALVPWAFLWVKKHASDFSHKGES
jgi:integral membrane protein